MFDTPLGSLALGTEDNAFVRLYLPDEPIPRSMPHKTPLLELGEIQLLEYFQGQRTQFDLPLNPQGTGFQHRVWAALSTIPYGETRSYGEIAQQIGCPKGARAVGMANRRNPLPILIPCHRVLGANGSLIGYAGGLTIQQRLLDLERMPEKTKGNT